MSNVYLVRHGQAGTREAYDSLSDLGQRQVSLLGQYFASQKLQFRVAYCGSMNRQQQTIDAIQTAYFELGLEFPHVSVDDDWNEFDLTGIYREIGPRLCEIDEEFRIEYEQMRIEVRQNRGVSDARVHRQWRPCDTKIVEAWISGRVEYSGETWVQFHDRVKRCVSKFDDLGPRDNILISTSATPTGVLTGLALQLGEANVRKLAGALYNSSYTLLRKRSNELQLIQFNAVPHLQAPELRTHR